MSTRFPAHVRVYRSRSGEAAVRSWCERELAACPGLRPLPGIVADGRSTRVHVLDGGPGVPVLVLPGAGLSSATLTGTARLLARDRTVILADLPGEPGLSCPLRPLGGRAAAYGAWLDALLPQVTDRPVVLLGHALGAAAVVSSLPSPLVDRLLLVNPAGLAAPVRDPGRLRATWAWQLSPGGAASARLLRAWGGPAGPGPLAEWMTLVGRHCRTVTVPGLLRGEEYRDWRGVPVTVATGSRDRVLSPALLGGAARRLLDTDVHVVGGAGHLVPHEAPEQVRDLLRGGGG
ncbi:alpha/beta fold hydrolase [Nocardiopsis sp. NPDC058631]|uniref:alpha/beta fold hydrolase n=1 Tax=Nocardiopsis sp. NPDC058631 TaxID=3346566 RepID=UPI0036563208